MRDASRLFCGFGTTFEQPGDWSRDAFSRWVGLRLGLPVQLGHDLVVTSAGVVREVGQVTDCALIDKSPIHPPGLLVLGHLHPGVVGDRVLADMRSPGRHRRRWGLSIAARVLRADGHAVLVMPTELSLTLTPAHERARVLGVGDDARGVWELLTTRAGLCEQN